MVFYEKGKAIMNITVGDIKRVYIAGDFSNDTKGYAEKLNDILYNNRLEGRITNLRNESGVKINNNNGKNSDVDKLNFDMKGADLLLILLPIAKKRDDSKTSFIVKRTIMNAMGEAAGFDKEIPIIVVNMPEGQNCEIDSSRIEFIKTCEKILREYDVNIDNIHNIAYSSWNEFVNNPRSEINKALEFMKLSRWC